MASNPVLFVKDAGRGTTPDGPQAKFRPGDVVRWARMGEGFIVVVAVPPRFLTGTARPLMITQPSRAVTYILVKENDPRPYLAKERNLRGTGERVDLGSVLYASEGSDAK